MRFKTDSLPKTPETKLKYLYRLQEKLRIFHNEKARQLKNGKITEEEFRKFQKGWFKKRNNLVVGEIIKCKTNLTKSQKEQLLEYNEKTNTFGAVKNKEQYKQDIKTKVSIDDIEEA